MSDEYTLPVNDDIYITGETEEVVPDFSEIDDDDSTQETVTRTPAVISSDNRSSIGSGELNPSPSDAVPADVSTSDVIVTQRVRHQIDDYEPAALKALSDAGAVFYGVYADGHEEGPVSWTEVYDLDPEGTIIELDEEIASAIAQNFWADTQGVHITDDPYNEWIEAYESNPQFPNLSTSKNYYNILLNAGGALLRRALNNLVSINRTAISFYDGLGNASTNIMAFFGRNGAQIGRSDEKHVVINSSGIGSYNGDGTVADFTMRGSSIVNSTISGSALVDNTITGGKIANATITGAKIDSGTITNANIANGTITGAKIDSGTITNANIADGTIQGSKIQGSTLTDIPFAAITDAEVEVASIADAQIATATITEAQVENLTTDYAHLQNGVIDNATINHADVNGLNTTYATISNLNSATARIDDLEADHVSVDDFEAEQGYIDALQAATADIATIRADSAKVHSLTAAQLSAATAYIAALNADNITAASLSADVGKIHNLTANEISAAAAYIAALNADSVTAQNIIAMNGDFATVKANAAKVANLTAAQLEADHATVGSLDANYAQINMANVNNAWIANGTIKDGAISNGMINSVSANKLTAGTIDASNITVTNLNADNITTGTINGQRIGEGSLSLSKLEEDVYTETEVDSIISNLQTQIDGAIETWTGTAVPTLSNSPASSWTTNAIKDTHVGDVYFVVNSQSQQNGYNYRFTKSGSTYSWQLIKDSDVTNALQRLTTAEGKIGTIEQFDSDISSWKTDTDEEISSIKSAATTLTGRVSTAEGQIATKVDTTTFNTLSQTVGENSSAITQLTTETTTINTKVDSQNPFIIGTQTAQTGSWTGNAPTLASLVDGQQITYWLPYAPSGNASLNLTLKDGSETGAIPCYYSGTSRLTTHYSANNAIHLTYRTNISGITQGWWADANYDSNTPYTKYSDTVISGKNGLKRYTLCMRDDAGNFTSIVNQANNTNVSGKTCYTGGLQLGAVCYHATGGDYAAGANSGVIYESYGDIDFRYSVNGVANATSTELQLRKPVYLVGTIGADGLFYLDTTKWWTQTSFVEGKAYVLVGTAYSSYYAIFVAVDNPTYIYEDDELVEIQTSRITKTTNKVNTVSDTVDEHTRKIGNLETTVETKADGSTVETISNNLNTISDTVSGHTQTISSITSTQTTMQGKLDKTLVETTQLWFSKADTTAPNKPTTQVTSTATAGNAWTTVVPAYNASYPNYYYCYQWKYSDGTYGWSSVTRDIAMGESQERARTAITNAANAQADIDGLEIGGRNLLRGTGNQTASNYATGRASVNDGILLLASTISNSYAKWIVDYLDYDEYGEGKYAASCDVRLANITSEYTNKSFKMYFGFSIPTRIPNGFNGSYDRFGTAIIDSNLITSEWIRIFIIFDVSDMTVGQAAALTSGSMLSIELCTDSSCVPIEVKNLKLERGNKATDWTPAPEDIDADISTAQTSADNAQATANKNVKESQQLWFTKANGSAPAKPTAKVTSTSTSGNAWTTKVPTYSSSYPYYFYCMQYIAADSTVTWSDVVYDQATTEAQSVARTTSANLSTLQSDYATFKQTTQNFESTIGTTYATKTELQTTDNKIENLEIGGRNLLANTSNESIAYTSISGFFDFPLTDWAKANIKTNDSLTLSFDAYSSTSHWIDFYWRSASTSYNSDVYFYPAFQVDDSTSHYTISSESGFDIDGNGILYLRLRNNSSRHGASAALDVTISNLKLEKGNRATDWTPAPEDVDAAIEASPKYKYVTSAYKATSQTYNTWLQWGQEGRSITNFALVDAAERRKLNIGDLACCEGWNATDNKPIYIVIEVTEFPSTTHYINGISHGLIDSEIRSTVNAIESRVSTAETSITQTNNQIALKANASDVYTKTQTDGLISTEVTNRNSAIEQSTNAINLSVSQTYTTKTEFNSLEVGGRNLLRNTNWTTESIATFVTSNSTIDQLGGAVGIWSRESQAVVSIDSNGLASFTITVSTRYGIYQDVILDPGTYTLSALTGANFHANISSAQWPSTNSLNQLPNGRNAITFDVTSKATYRVYVNCSNGSTVAGNYLKLERGNKATDWSPAPEDMATTTALESARSEIQQTTDGITSTVEKISSAKYLTSAYAGWSLTNIKAYGSHDTQTTFTVASTDGVRVGDTVYIKGTDATRNCTVYIKGVVKTVSSATSVTVYGRGYEDILPVESIKSTINQSADSVKIEARHVNIEGAAIFSSGRLSETSLNNAYDTKGAAASLVAGGDNLIGGFNNNYIVSGEYNYRTGRFQSKTTSNTADGTVILQYYSGTTATSMGTFVSQHADVFRVANVGETCSFKFEKPSGFTHLHLKFNGNQQDARVAWDVTPIPVGTELILTFKLDSISSDGKGNGGVMSGINLRTGNIPSQWSLAPDDVEIGGRNLLPWSAPSAENYAKIAVPSSSNSFTTEDGYACYKITGGATNGAHYASSGKSLVSLEADTQYTYSAWVKLTTTGSATNVPFNFTRLGHFSIINAASTASDNTHEDVSAKRIYSPATVNVGVWTKIQLTFTTNSLGGSKFGLYPKYNLGDTYTLFIRDQKLEKGSKATDWTPAPEDVTADISAAAASAKEYADGLPAYKVLTTNYSYSLDQWTAYAAEGRSDSWTQAGPAKANDTVLIKGTNSDTGGAIYVLVTVNVVSSSGAINNATSHGLIDPTVGQRLNDAYEKIQSRGEQLIVNGNGFMGDNTNFSSLTFDGSVTNGSPGSFTYANGTNIQPSSDEMFPVDPSKNYRVEFDVTSSGSGASPRMFGMLYMYDVDKKLMNVQQCSYIVGSTTTLARELKNGDTTVYLTDASGFIDTSAAHQRSLIFWDYTNSFGYTYPPETYSRNFVAPSGGLWSDYSKINKTNNTITLTSAWTGGTHVAGTSVSQNSSGATYAYFWSTSNVPADVWTHVSSVYDGYQPAGVSNAFYKFYRGTAYCKIAWLWNHQGSSSNPQRQLWVTNISVREDVATSADLNTVKSNAVKRTQRIYCRKSSVGAPSTPGISSSNWVTQTSDVFGQWTAKVPRLTANADGTGTKYLYLYTCEQREMGNGTLSYTTVLLDDSNTIIDGGTIITGSIAANKLDVYDATIGKISTSAINLTGYAQTNDIPTKVSDLTNDSGFQDSSQVETAITSKGYATQNSLNSEINQRKANYGTCSTAAATQAKAVTCSNFELVAGNELTVKFTTANTYASGAVQLNVNSKGAKNVWVANAVTSSSNQLLWGANAYITFRYDGTQFIAIGEPRTWYGASTTAEGTAAKTDTTAVTGCVICKGAKVELAMTNANTAAAPTLNIQSTGAKNVYFGNGTARPTKADGTSWLATNTCTFTFDGQYWRTAGKTYIDANSIITGYLSADRIEAGSLSANKISATSGTFDTANIPDLSAAKITSGDISADRIKANVISAINSLTAGQIDAGRINASQLSIGQSQVTNLTSDLADAKKHTQVIVSATNVDYAANTCTLTARFYIDGVLQTATSLKWQWYRDGTTQGSQTTGATGSLAVTSSLGLAHRYGCKCTF